MSFEDLDDKEVLSEEAHERRIRRCKSTKCNAKIIWLFNDTGKKVPADEATVEAGDRRFIWDRHSCHFDTCKDPGTWGRRR